MPVPPCVHAWHRPREFGTWSVSSRRHTSIMGASSVAAAQSLSAEAGLLLSRGINRPSQPHPAPLLARVYMVHLRVHLQQHTARVAPGRIEWLPLQGGARARLT